jgi:hypothetical protein
MTATTVLRWFHPRSDPPIVQTVIVETEGQLALRNQQRLEQAKRTLGGRYILHPTNKVSRQHEERPRTLATRPPLPDNLRKSQQGIPGAHRSQEQSDHRDRS